MVEGQEAGRLGKKTVEEIAASLRRRAVELWGAGRADEIGHVIEETARDLWLVSRVQLAGGDEPAFYPHWRRAQDGPSLPRPPDMI